MASKNIFQPLTELTTPIFDRFANSSAGVQFTGEGAYLDPKNEFVFPILRAEATTVSAHPEKGASGLSGEQLTLVSGFQTRYNNRVALSGSMEICSDEQMVGSEANLKFCLQLANWVF